MGDGAAAAAAAAGPGKEMPAWFRGAGGLGAWAAGLPSACHLLLPTVAGAPSAEGALSGRRGLPATAAAARARALPLLTFCLQLVVGQASCPAHAQFANSPSSDFFPPVLPADSESVGIAVSAEQGEAVQQQREQQREQAGAGGGGADADEQRRLQEAFLAQYLAQVQAAAARQAPGGGVEEEKQGGCN